MRLSPTIIIIIIIIIRMEALEADYSKRIHFSLHFLGFIIQASCENAAVKNGWLVRSIPHSLCRLSWQSGSQLWMQGLRYNFAILILIGWSLALRARRCQTERVRLCSGHLPVKEGREEPRETKTATGYKVCIQARASESK